MGCVHSRHRFRRKPNKLQKPESSDMEEYVPEHEHEHEHEPEQEYVPEEEYVPAEEHHHEYSEHEERGGIERVPSPREVVSEIEDHIEQRLHHLVRPHRFRSGYRPSFYAAYARAARRWQFEASKYGSFAFRQGMVVKVRSMRDNSTDHEVPAEAIQNGAGSPRSLD